MTAPTSTGGNSKEALRRAGEDFAKKSIDKVFTGSKILNNSQNFPVFDKKELTLGKVLGKGGFGTVYEVRGFSANQPMKRRDSTKKLDVDLEEPSTGGGEMESRAFIAEHCLRNGGDARYAVKFLSKEVIEDPPTYIQAIMDMAVETVSMVLHNSEGTYLSRYLLLTRTVVFRIFVAYNEYLATLPIFLMNSGSCQIQSTQILSR